MPSLKLKAIKPKHLPSSKEYVDAIKQAVHRSANLSKRDLEATTRTWNHKPDFEVKVEQSGDEFSITAETDDAIYGYVDDGTEAHIIRPKRSRFLRFRVGGRPKTRVGVIGSQPGAAGTDFRSAETIHHPGGRARKFTETIRKRRQKTLEQEISQGIAKVARKQA